MHKDDLKDVPELEYLKDLGFKMYYDFNGSISCPRIICQVDSLFKLISNVKYDLLVIDEFTYMQDHLVTFTAKKSECNRTLEELQKYVPRVIIADALLDDDNIEYLRSLGRTDIAVFQYTHQPHIEKTYIMVDNKEELAWRIVEAVKKGKKVVVPTNIENYATPLTDLLRGIYPDIKIGLYTGKNKKWKSS